jgi:dihydroorotase (multifunctional complex type)
MEKDINIINGICVTPKGEIRADIAIRNGIITQICEQPGLLETCRRTYDASGCIVFPGMIDTHVHIRGGEFSYREDFYTGSQAAAASGITTILEMPGCAKPAFNEKNYIQRVNEVKRDGAINFGLYGAAGYDNLDQIPKLAEIGAIGFKTFQMAPVKGREKEFYGMCAETYDDMLNIMRAVVSTGRTLTVHCESQKMIDQLVPGLKKQYPTQLIGFILSRPEEAELRSVALTIRAAKKTGCRTIIAHVSSPLSMHLIMEAKEEGYSIYAETCAQYLNFDMDEMKDFGEFGRMKPPFRKRESVDEMVKLYGQGAFDITGSDHAPYTIEEKRRNGGDIWNSVDGLYGLEMTLPILLNLHAQGKVSYSTIADCFSRRAADLFHLRGKGQIKEGADGDLCMVRKLEKPYLFDKNQMHIKCKEAAVIYDGMPMHYEIAATILGGDVVYDNKTVCLRKGTASILKPQESGAAG